jgi:hypothetical protein
VSQPKQWIAKRVHGFDRAWGRLTGRRTVLVDARTPVNFAILAPVVTRLQRDPGVRVLFSAVRPAECADAARACGMRGAVQPRGSMTWRRIDLCLNADPWEPIELRRCLRRVNFFHGMAGKYDLDQPSNLPIGFDIYDRVMFINDDRMQRYIAAGIVTREAAALVGYPKVDALVNGQYDAAAIRDQLQLEMHRPVAIYAPTWSTASSLHLAGEAIVESLVDSGFNVIVKLHDRSLDASEPRFTGGIDWRARFARMRRPGRIAFSEAADSSPLLAASDVMVTDHSSIGFEFLLLDRPLVIFDAPDLAAAARINPGKIQLLRSAARVVAAAGDVGPTAVAEMRNRPALTDRRRDVTRAMFHEPGTATERAVGVIYDLLERSAPVAAHHARPAALAS